MCHIWFGGTSVVMSFPFPAIITNIGSSKQNGGAEYRLVVLVPRDWAPTNVTVYILSVMCLCHFFSINTAP